MSKAPKAPKPLKGKKLDNEISRCFGKHGKVINVLNIKYVFAAGRAANEAGESIEEAVRLAAIKYAEPEGGDEACTMSFVR